MASRTAAVAFMCVMSCAVGSAKSTRRRIVAPVTSDGSVDVNVQIFAAYWPQWHATPLNDYWFGSGFTDWTLLCSRLGFDPGKAFNKHGERLTAPLQPPDGFGWYNLTDRNVRQRQALLAKEYGVYGFAIYHYWFDRPSSWGKPRSWGTDDFGADVDETMMLLLEDGEPDIPFFFIWANEQWTWKWRTLVSGRAAQLHADAVQVNVTYAERSWRAHFDYLLRFFRHRNYHRIDGMPVLGLHSLIHVPPAAMLDSFRRWAIEAGFPGLNVQQSYAGKTGHFVNHVPMYGKDGKGHGKGFAPWADGVIEFGWRSEFGTRRIAPPAIPDTNWTYGIITDFDNTARMGKFRALIGKKAAHLGGPPNFEMGLAKIVNRTIRDARRFGREDAMLFVVAWNEWSEQATLEPSDRYGIGYLEALRNVLRRYGQYRFTGQPGLWRSVVSPPPQLTPCQYGLNITIARAHNGWPERRAISSADRSNERGLSTMRPGSAAFTQRALLEDGESAGLQWPVRSGIAVYTAVFGGFEKTFKEPLNCTGADFLAFTDNLTIARPQSCWRVVIAAQHLEADPRSRGMPNSIETYRTNAAIAKYYKLNAHILRELRSYAYAIWLDGTLELRASVLSAPFTYVIGNTSTISTFEHCTPQPWSKWERCRHGRVAVELFQTMNVKRLCCPDPCGPEQQRKASCAKMYVDQDFERQRRWYLEQSGFQEHWFAKLPEAQGRREYGVWVTCLVIMNLASSNTTRFLDQWWIENANTTLQDQVTFPYTMWRTRVMVQSLPAHGVSGSFVHSTLHRKRPHNK